MKVITKVEVLEPANKDEDNYFDFVRFTYDNGETEEQSILPDGTRIEQIKLTLRSQGCSAELLDQLDELCTVSGYNEACQEHEIHG
jgi:hypothetical protein